MTVGIIEDRDQEICPTGALQLQGAPADNRGGWLYDMASVRFVLDHEDYDHL